MAQTRETRLTLSGLVTQPNKYLAEPGSLARAENVMIRQPGVIEPRIAFEDTANPGGGNNDYPRRIESTDLGVVVFLDGGGSFSPHGEFYTTETPALVHADDTSTNITQENAGAITSRGAVGEARGRVFLDQNGRGSGPEIVRAIDPADTTKARRGGLIPPSWINAQPGSPGKALLSAKFAAYRAHFERQHADGYVQIGPVSPVTLIHNISVDEQVSLTVYWSRIATGNAWVKIGDYIRVYRTDNADSADEVGDTMRLAASVQLNSTDISNFFVTVIDVSPDAGLGAFLYSNSGQGGSDESKWFPPSATDIVPFRNVNWYVSPYALRSFELRVPGGWGLFLAGAAGRDVGVGLFKVTASGVVMGNATFTANDPVGLSPGQVLAYSSLGGAGAWLVGAKIVSVVGTTVTMNSNAINGSFTDAIFGDVIEINGISYEAYSPARLVRSVALSSSGSERDFPAWVFPSLPISFSDTQVQFETLYTGSIVEFVSPSYAGDTHAVRATNGARYSPALPELASTAISLGSDDPRSNRAHFSEIEEPEAVPVLNYRFFGHGTLLKLIAVEDAMLAFCTDGTYVCTGDGQNWDIRDFDRALKLLHRHAVDVLEGTVWALTNRGVVAISGGSTQEVSTPFIGNRIRELEEQYSASFEPLASTSLGAYNVMLRCDPYHKEVWIRWQDDSLDGVTLIFNVESKSWTELTDEIEAPTALGYDPSRKSMLLGTPGVGAHTNMTIRASLPDTSPSPDSRMAAGAIRLNPYAGGDLNTRKEWLEAVYDLEFPAGGDLEILPFFGDKEYNTPYLVSAGEGDQEHVVKVQRAAARSKQLSPGFEVTGTAALDTAPVWKLSGVTVKYRVASPDTRRK